METLVPIPYICARIDILLHEMINIQMCMSFTLSVFDSFYPFLYLSSWNESTYSSTFLPETTGNGQLRKVISKVGSCLFDSQFN